jgi:hypothetical protein
LEITGTSAIRVNMVTQKRLKELLNYNSVTGTFRWKVNPRGRKLMGTEAGTKKSHPGYVTILIDRKRYKAHRLAWLYVYGVMPEGQVDHVDLDGTNNAIANLREATNSQNNQNKVAQSNNTSGHQGIRIRSDRPNKPYRASICVQGQHQSKSFSTLEEAVAWRQERVEELHPFAPA